MLIYIVLTTLPPSMTNVATNWTAVAMIILYEVVFAFGWLGTCWVYGPEIAPLKYRHVAGSLGAAGEWFSTWIMVFGGGTGINAVGPKIFIWPLLCCFLAAAYVYLYCPESKSSPKDTCRLTRLEISTKVFFHIQQPEKHWKRSMLFLHVHQRFANGWHRI
jgi:hypothetical protein